jgi:hypothetical protein
MPHDTTDRQLLRISIVMVYRPQLDLTGDKLPVNGYPADTLPTEKPIFRGIVL